MVRSNTFEIRWHETQPIYSCSFQPVAPAHLRRVLEYNYGQAAGLPADKTFHSDPTQTAGPSTRTSQRVNAPLDIAGGQNWRLATAGGDNNVRIWLVKPSIPSPGAMASAAAAGLPSPAPHPARVEYLATLARHSGVVNCVRFSPSGDLLASAGDDGTVMLWHLTDRPVTTFGDPAPDDADSTFEKEHWRMTRMIRVSSQEIYDMAWSPNGDSIVVGGTDFVARIVNPHDGTVLKEFSDHTHYVQGVAWDPLGEYLATQSSDRSVHVHTLQNKAAATPAVSSATTSSTTANSGYVPPVTRNSKLDLHRRTGSGNLAWSADHGTSKPNLRRGSSHASQIESDTEGEACHWTGDGPSSASKRRDGNFTAVRGRTARSHTPMEPPSTMPHAHGATPHPPTVARAATPTPASSVPQSPAFSTASASGCAHPMNPPQKTPSRRSSFSGSQAEVATSPPTSIASFPAAGGITNASSAASIYKAAVHGSAEASTGPAHPVSSSRARRSASRPGSIRSPSPAPLPAIRPPPSPRQRLQAAQLLNSAHSAAPAGSMLQVGMRMYGDESFSGFFRRLAFSPDGALLATPSGIFEAPSPASPIAPSHSPSKSPGIPHPGMSHHGVGPGPRSTVYIYGRASLTRSNAPIAHLPGHKTATLVVRFSPILYELRKTQSSAFARAEDGGGIAPHPNIPLEAGRQKSVNLSLVSTQEMDELRANAADATVSPRSGLTSPSKSPLPPPPPPISMIGLPYRMVFAVATHDVVWIYDTQQGGPLCCFSNMHYASFTDLSWSADGQTLIMSSSDGYCSVAAFDHGELGAPYSYAQQPSLSHSAMATLPASSVHPTSSAANVVTLSTKKKPSASASSATPQGALSGGKVPPTPPTPSPAHLPNAVSPTDVKPGTRSSAATVPTSSSSSSMTLNASTPKRAVLTTTAAGTASGAGQPTPEAAANASEPKPKKRRIQPTLHQRLAAGTSGGGGSSAAEAAAAAAAAAGEGTLPGESSTTSS
ncbi:unnamed protein product [Parajaminaea phylloscopi]